MPIQGEIPLNCFTYIVSFYSRVFQTMDKKRHSFVMVDGCVFFFSERVLETQAFSAETSELSRLPCNNANGQIGTGASTKALLLGKPRKHEKRQMKEHVIAMRHTELEEVKDNSEAMDSKDQGSTVSHYISIWNNEGRSSSQNLQKNWCHQVRIVLSVDALVCIVLFLVWLGSSAFI
ncbi:unnamed protein product [Fraxinus pennsylvanica]|uniref:Uncharacterized protein n=1 Tax=Fraxinus pennsylvanica TaxID=56036 RepID=A0AAD2E341_9LAMI|nr:unnamed protein product [Fraxinus pennsylvanica]